MSRRSVSLYAALGLVLAAIVVAGVPELNWRVQVILLKVRGELPGIPAGQLISWLRPGSPVWLGGLPDRPNASAAIQNTRLGDETAVAAGSEHFQRTCSHCHGADAKGGAGPSLIDFVSTSSDWDFFAIAKWGRMGSAMAAQPLTDQQIWEVEAHVRQLARTWAAEAAGRSLTREPINVTAEMLQGAAGHPEDWLTYAGDLTAHRHSALTQINKANAGKLKVAWAAQLRSSTKPLSATPIVADGLMFVTEAPDGIVALDAKTGALVWRYRRPVDPSKLPLCCGAFNRGIAIRGDKVYVLTLDAYLVAVSTATGRMVWQTKVAESREGYSMTSAPLAVDGHVMVGVAGGEFGIRGIVAAFSPEDGRLLWTFNVIPGPGEPGHDTWKGDSWKTGGGPTWSTGAYDKDLDVVYWTTGNPWPPLDTKGRAGDNLYTNSVVALDLQTGKLRWYYQFTPADSHDWDSAQQPILADINWQGQKVPALLLANRNGFYYALDRRNGKFLLAKAFVKQTWNRGFDAQGRPDRDPASLPSPRGTLVWPWMHGGTNWWAPSYDPQRHLHFVPSVDAATLYFSMDMSYVAGHMTLGGTTRLATSQPAAMAIKAIDPDTGEVRWSSRLDKGDFHQFARIGGLVSTDGGIIFGGYEGRFVVLDSDTGIELWTFSPGGLTNAGAATYAVDGTQYIAAIAGNVLFAFDVPAEAAGGN
ncbi:MAG: PQQ-binding-like beta-propeller repeat protein [Gammaproteobacteria bacterium]